MRLIPGVREFSWLDRHEGHLSLFNAASVDDIRHADLRATANMLDEIHAMLRFLCDRELAKDEQRPLTTIQATSPLCVYPMCLCKPGYRCPGAPS